ncbi:NAD(P)/FAD-dependent oxidoreductase [Pseudoalteromonas luteoviolacea]|uniref:NAD(P)/FAD-dependent oxidoreductase n=1 Tax=Pseudoalteromonas luteoviolacea TaxID=43657 RepID=UPI001B3847A2|nr:NAD(P)/FAD-dependent oxidoreductase [Pseudoalteromonas luteoviolacea]MBQ4813191.1 NAD(P)/FAD-dependent oxidoreductase [Pseudoalteromonas luteoviolacea]
MEQVDTLVIGAGVIGLAIAARLSKHSEVVLVEQGHHFGEHTSSRNSEVIHAGIYYPSNSIKAHTCVEGKAQLYTHCTEFSVPFARIGKVITAQNTQEEEKLASLLQQAQNNGVDDLCWLSKEQLVQKAPQINAIAGLYSPSTGIVDSHQFMLSLLGQLESHQGQYVSRTQFVGAIPTANGFAVKLDCDGTPFELRCRHLVNAGGLFAQHNATLIEGLQPIHVPAIHYCRGQYFSYQGSHPFKHLIYPVPEQHGLGIHATLDLAGQLRFGPDTQFIDELNYETDGTALEAFYQAIKRYWPNVDKRRLQLDYAGIRPKTQRQGQQDFQIEGKSIHGLAGLVNLFGIESPGLTASLAIAKAVEAQLVAEHK